MMEKCTRKLEEPYRLPADHYERAMVWRTDLCAERMEKGEEPLFECKDCLYTPLTPKITSGTINLR